MTTIRTRMSFAIAILGGLLAVACGGAQPASLAAIDGDHIRLGRHINFATDSDVILEDSNDLLDAVANILRTRTDITTLHVIGHTDASGEADHNQNLSERRAAAVEQALRDRGAQQTMDSRGAGESEPLCEEDTDECNARNRRVEFVIELG